MNPRNDQPGWLPLVNDLLQLQLEADFSRPQMHGFATVYSYCAHTGFVTCHLLHRDGCMLNSGPVDSHMGEHLQIAQDLALALVIGGVDD
jgi:hypothetical protein